MLNELLNRIKKNDSWRLNNVVLHFTLKRLNKENIIEIDLYYILISSDEDIKKLILFFLDYITIQKDENFYIDLEKGLLK
jgi:hypothetical protein